VTWAEDTKKLETRPSHWVRVNKKYRQTVSEPRGNSNLTPNKWRREHTSKNKWKRDKISKYICQLGKYNGKIKMRLMRLVI
jgi:hypothetical protein